MLQVDAVKEELLRTDEQFRTLFEEHQEYEQRLLAIRQKSLPSEQDEMEIKRIKIHKLALKDRMEALLHAHTRAHATA